LAPTTARNRDGWEGYAMNAVPAALDWRLPAEWEPHEATWIAWPKNRSDWPGKFAPIPWVYAEIVRHLHQAEYVHLIVDDTLAEARVRKILKHNHLDLERVRF